MLEYERGETLPDGRIKIYFHQDGSGSIRRYFSDADEMARWAGAAGEDPEQTYLLNILISSPDWSEVPPGTIDIIASRFPDPIHLTGFGLTVGISQK